MEKKKLHFLPGCQFFPFSLHLLKYKIKIKVDDVKCG